MDEQEFIEPDFMDEEIDESQRLDNNEQLKSKEEVDQKIEETELFLNQL